ncbi:MAG: EF-hand domain-containing protein [Betaproteobacteria bacterium]|nr:EF-hand domain-containing protein [Betaproteobacteria bacterium]
MSLKRNVLSMTVATVFLLSGNAITAMAADATQSSGHQHQSGHASGHSHGDAKSGDQNGHQCEHMSVVDTNKDGKISKEEFMKHHEAMFDKKDVNKDGFIDREEMHRMMDHMHKHGDDAHTHDDTKK